MKKFLLVMGILLIVASVLSLAFAAINWFGYYHVLDGSHDLYERLNRRRIIFGIAGLVLTAIGIVCLIIRTK